MKGKNITKLVIWLLLAAVSVYVVFMGFWIGFNEVLGGAYDARLGRDLEAGVYAVFTPERVLDEDGEVTNQEEIDRITNADLDRAVEIFRHRLDSLRGVLNSSTILADRNNNSIILQVAGLHPSTILDLGLGEVTDLWFADIELDDEDEVVLGDDGEALQVGERLIYGENITNGFILQNGFLLLEFNSAGRTQLENISREFLNDTIGLFIDGRLLVEVDMEEVITDGQLVINTGLGFDQVVSLINRLESGMLPFALTIEDGNFMISEPMLGGNALNIMVLAGLIAFALLLLILLAYYRLPGLIATIVLATQAALLILWMIWLAFEISVPGIAGIVIAMGICIGVSILALEKIRDEKAKGKDMTSAIRDGYKSILGLVIGSHVFLMIAALIMWILGTGALSHFAVPLVWGLILNFVTAVWMLRSMLLSADKLSLFKGFGCKCSFLNKERNYVEKRKLFLAASCIVILIGIVGTVVMGGPRFSVEYQGGVIVNIAIPDESDNIPNLERRLSNLTGRNVAIQNSSYPVDGNREFPTLGDLAVILDLRIATQTRLTDDAQEIVRTRLEEVLGDDIDIPEAEFDRSEIEQGSVAHFTVIVRSGIPFDQEDAEYVRIMNEIEEDLYRALTMIGSDVIAVGTGFSHVFNPLFSEIERHVLVIEISGLSGSAVDAEVTNVRNAIAEEFDIVISQMDGYYNVSVVSSSTGNQLLLRDGILILAVVLLMILYIWFRFNFFKGASGLRAGLVSAVALVHDAVIMLLAAGIFRLTINRFFIAAVAGVLIYSIYNSTILFGKIKELMNNDSKLTMDEVVNTSISGTLQRNAITTGVLKGAIAILIVFALINQSALLMSFALPFVVGIIAAFFSSSFIVPMLFRKKVPPHKM